MGVRPLSKGLWKQKTEIFNLPLKVTMQKEAKFGEIIVELEMKLKGRTKHLELALSLSIFMHKKILLTIKSDFPLFSCLMVSKSPSKYV